MARRDTHWCITNYECQRRIAKGIRVLTGVKSRDHWPVYIADGPERLNQDTGVRYYDIHLGAEAGIDDNVNTKLIERVASDVVKALQVCSTWSNHRVQSSSYGTGQGAFVQVAG